MNKKQHNTSVGSFLILLTGIFFVSTQTASAFEKQALRRTILLENTVELSSKTINSKTIRVIFPPAFKTPDHTHEGPGPRYVAKGKLKVTEGNKTNIYSAGDVFWESGQLMSVENLGEDTAEIIIFELVPDK